MGLAKAARARIQQLQLSLQRQPSAASVGSPVPGAGASLAYRV